MVKSYGNKGDWVVEDGERLAENGGNQVNNKLQYNC